MKIYISGPITGVPEHNFPAFAEAEDYLLRRGYTVLNPTATGVIGGWTWADYLRADLAQLVGADGVATLPGWVRSRGACLEVYVAKALGMGVRALHQWRPLS